MWERTALGQKACKHLKICKPVYIWSQTENIYDSIKFGLVLPVTEVPIFKRGISRPLSICTKLTCRKQKMVYKK